MKLGVTGLPNVGKSTVFNAITNAGAECANYPFCTIEPNIGTVPVPDNRLQKLAEIYNAKKVIPATVEFVDIAGLVKGAGKGEGLGNKFLSHIRETDAIVHVVRCFEDANIAHVDNTIDPVRDIETVNIELIFSDIEIINKRIEKTKIMMKSGNNKYKTEFELYERIKENLEKGIPVRTMEFDYDQKVLVDNLFLLTSKPVLFIANIAENDIGSKNNKYVNKVKSIAEKENAKVVPVCAKIEEEVAALDDDEMIEFLNELGIKESGLSRLIKASYSLLGLISFLTFLSGEVRAWPIKRGTKAVKAAGKIHTDFERGFIRAEVISFDALVRMGNFNAAREKGLVRSEGKDYIINDGDVILFRFNV